MNSGEIIYVTQGELANAANTYPGGVRNIWSDVAALTRRVAILERELVALKSPSTHNWSA